MPKDRLLYPENEIKQTKDPVEMAKRFLDQKDAKYECQYLPVDDCYIIEITQRGPISDDLAQRIRTLGFSATGKRRFFFKRYSVITQNTPQVQPIWGDGMFDAQPLNPAPDPFLSSEDV